MTSDLIEYFKSYAKFDKETNEYYIDNLKTVFNYYFITYDEKDEDKFEVDYGMVDEEIEDYKQYLKTNNEWLSESQIKELDEKHCISLNTIIKVIDIFYYLDKFNFNFDDEYKNQFSKYILYVLEKKRTIRTKQANKYMKYKKIGKWIKSYQMNYQMLKRFTSSSIERIENRVNEIIDYKIKSKLSTLLNNNNDLLKDLIKNLNEESKNILIDEIIKYNEGEIINRVSKKLKSNKVVNKMCLNIMSEADNQIKTTFTGKLNQFIESDKSNKIYENGLNHFITFHPASQFGKSIMNYGKEIGIYNCNELNEKIKAIDSKIESLKVEYLRCESSENNSLESSEDSENNSSENEKVDFSDCFKLHGKSQFNMNIKNLMKHSNIKNFNEFKDKLIEKNIIKKDFKLVGSSYRLTKDQKETFINEFLIFIGK